jgi:hypothetical protein
MKVKSGISKKELKGVKFKLYKFENRPMGKLIKKYKDGKNIKAV